jgi:5-methylcytosine-specific restriction endonuclease McrBC GTP-binding regulatory subunit McrB
MNTADRSVEALDTALRRRFTFEEMSPDYSIIEKLSGENGVLEGVNLVKLLDTVNSRLEILLDKDHKIGHSYFLGLKNLLELKNAFRNKILPLFEEYFFGDFGKLGLVLGSSFVQKKNKETVSFAKFEDYDPYLSQDLLQKDVFTITDEINWDFKSIYE